MQIKKKGQGGFTLIELLVVVVIIGILASVAVPNFMGAQDKAKNSGVQANGHTVQMALEQYAVDYSGVYPASLVAAAGGEGLVVGAASDYLTAFPNTPWNKQQVAQIDILPAHAAKKINETIAGGTLAVPTEMTHYGALAYTHSGTANEKYDMVGTGKKGSNAIVVFKVKNY
jgi:type II secretion system protein G